MPSFLYEGQLDGFILLRDNAYPWGTNEHFQSAFLNLYADQLCHTPLWPRVGNHGLDTACQYAFFTQDPTPADPLRIAHACYYSFDQGNIHFAVLDPWETWRKDNTDPKQVPRQR